MTDIYNQIFEYRGALPGPTLTILAGVHGNEIPGIRALEKLISSLSGIKRGKLFLLFGNQRAIMAKVRETKQNLNRMFRDDLPEDIRASYEFERATLIRRVLDQSDICLDLHASNSSISPVFAITEPSGFELAKQLPVAKIVSNIDPFHPGSTDGYMAGRGKIGICVECGFMEDPQAIERADRTIAEALSALDMIDSFPDFRPPSPSREIFRVSGIYKSRSAQFVLEQTYLDFQLIPAGTIIGTDAGERVSFEKDFYILFARNSCKAEQECFLRVEKI